MRSLCSGETILLWLFTVIFKITKIRGAWVAQSVKRLTSAQVMISWSVGSSPVSGSVLTAQRLEPASGSVSPSLSAPPPLSLSVSLKNKIKTLKKIKMTSKYKISWGHLGGSVS